MSNQAEYQDLVLHFSSEGFKLYASNFSLKHWNNYDLFMSKYWFSESEFNARVKENLSKIFNFPEKGYPKTSFKKGYDLIYPEPGLLILEEDFTIIKNLTKIHNDNFFYVIQNDLGGLLREPFFRMKFPSEISWHELMSGGAMSTALFEMPYNEYFIVGEGTKWGAYIANENFPPISIYGSR